MNTKLRKTAKNLFEQDFLELINNSVFKKTIENFQKSKEIQVIPTEMRKKYFVSLPSYYTTDFFTENLLAIEMIKTQIRLFVSVYQC